MKKTAGGIKTNNFAKFHDGFSFTVESELDAYKAAYEYRACKRVKVTYAPNVGEWLVQVYN